MFPAGNFMIYVLLTLCVSLSTTAFADVMGTISQRNGYNEEEPSQPNSPSPSPSPTSGDSISSRVSALKEVLTPLFRKFRSPHRFLSNLNPLLMDEDMSTEDTRLDKESTLKDEAHQKVPESDHSKSGDGDGDGDGPAVAEAGDDEDVATTVETMNDSLQDQDIDEKPLDIKHFYNVKEVVHRRREKAHREILRKDQQSRSSTERRKRGSKSMKSKTSQQSKPQSSRQTKRGLDELQEIIARRKRRDFAKQNVGEHLKVPMSPPPAKHSAAYMSALETLDAEQKAKAAAARRAQQHEDHLDEVKRLREFIKKQQREIKTLKESRYLVDE